MPKPSFVSLSADKSCVDEEDSVQFPPEYINSLNASGIPPHELHLKEDCIVMLMRNLSKVRGLCNGSKLLVDKISTRLLQCRILGGVQDGRVVLIPRIILKPQCLKNQPCDWQRIQFPVRVAYAMTISKSQGQTLDFAGIYLNTACFGHGQLYVASSRTGNPDTVLYAVKARPDMEPFTTRNVVYKEIFS